MRVGNLIPRERRRRSWRCVQCVESGAGLVRTSATRTVTPPVGSSRTCRRRRSRSRARRSESSFARAAFGLRRTSNCSPDPIAIFTKTPRQRRGVFLCVGAGTLSSILPLRGRWGRAGWVRDRGHCRPPVFSASVGRRVLRAVRLPPNGWRRARFRR